MKGILIGGLLVGFTVCNVYAWKPTTSTEVVRPTTSVTVVRPLTKVDAVHLVTSVEVFHPTTQTEVFHPQTNVQTFHPTTQVQVNHPQTSVEVFHPQTTVEVFHPQTTVEVFHPQTPEIVNGDDKTTGSEPQKGGKTGASSQATTSMSDFKPMQAKNLSAKPPTDKAAPTGGGDMNLGNVTNEAEKDNANKSSLLGAQKSAENIEVDPKQNKLDGLEKLLTDRAKFQEKKK